MKKKYYLHNIRELDLIKYLKSRRNISYLKKNKKANKKFKI